MLDKRPIVNITIGYIIGIIMGLYCKISIVFLYIIFLGLYLIIILKKKIILNTSKIKNKFKLISLSRYFRYVKLIFNKKVLVIIIISSIISNTIFIICNYKYEKIYYEFDNIDVIAIVASNCVEKEKTNRYKMRIESINGNNKYKGINLYLYIKKNKESYNLRYGDKICISGKYEPPAIQKNYRGFDYREYLKSFKIYGKVFGKNIEIEENNCLNIKDRVLKCSNTAFLNIKDIIQSNFNNKTANILLSVLFGYKEEIDEIMMNNFLESNMIYLLTVSGFHIWLIVLGIRIFFEKFIGKKKTKIVIGILLIIYMFISGLSLSVIRAVIMTELMILSKLLYRKSDIWQNISFALLVFLIYNPFLVLNTSFLLTFIGTSSMFIKPKWIKGNIKTSLFITITMAPVLICFFNKIPVLSIIPACLGSFLLAPIIYLGFIFLILSNFLKLSFLKQIISFICNVFIRISELGEAVPLNKIYFSTPSLLFIILYYLLLFIVIIIKKNYSLKILNASQRRIRNLVSLFKYRLIQKKKRVISLCIIIVFITCCFKIIPKNLKIYFIDVGQGDSCLIVTPKNKKILIDGGGSENNLYDVGKNVLLPYLLDRRIMKIDYIIISHFDSDHVRGLFTIIKELKVRKIIISKQFEDSENYKEFKTIIRDRNVNVIEIKKGDRIKIEEDIYFDILWPNNKNIVKDNILNNNSIVCKFCFKDFSILFTGDIEEKAEKVILEEYKNRLNSLKADVLKIAHHGSKTSSMLELLNSIRPSIGLIGVGEKNIFGHPNQEVLDRLKRIGCRVYRTDIMGEISIIVNRFGKYKIKKFIK